MKILLLVVMLLVTGVNIGLYLARRSLAGHIPGVGTVGLPPFVSEGTIRAEWEASAVRGPTTPELVEHPTRGDAFIFSVHLPPPKGPIEVSGSVVRGAVTLQEANTREEDTHLAPVHVPGNRHYTLHPVRLTPAQRETAERLLIERWQRFNRNTLDEWMTHHMEHGINGQGETGGLDGRQAVFVWCGCGEEFRGETSRAPGFGPVPEGFYDAIGRAWKARRADGH